jgi:hypothetical protein
MKPFRFVTISLCAVLLSACAGGAETRSATSVLPASTGATGPADTLAGGVRRTKSTSPCSVAGTGSFDGAPANANAASGLDAVVGGGIHDRACDDYTTVAGGYYNAVSSADNNNGSEWSFIGGGYTNEITNGQYSVIAGGLSNLVYLLDGTNAAATVGGGAYNIAGGVAAAVAGGYADTASANESFVGAGFHDTASNQYAAVAGGEYNKARGEGSYVGGGGYNTASGEGAIVDGGFNSTANGTFATIPGGYVNAAAGTYSFAAGARASAAQTGTFVWSDGSDGDTILTSSRAYQFLARASGGVTFWTNAASTVGATLAPGSGTWASASDRNLKTDVARIDDAAMLEKVAALPVSRWSYKSERGVRHVGPMAQDFYAAFGVGEDDKHITSIDEDGVALAAIKALHAENARLRARQEKMQMQLDRLVATVSALHARR